MERKLKEKKWEGKKIEGKLLFFLLFGLEKNTKEKNDFPTNFFALFGTRKINQEKKFQDRQDQTKQFTSHFLQSLFENYLPAK